MSETATEQRPTKRIVEGHRITWWVHAWDGQGHSEKLRHTSTMRGLWGWDASCECGWESRTGGATKSSVQRDVRDHKCDVTGDWRQL